MIGYLDASRMLVAWCELRRDFRSFRVDRIKTATFLDERYPERAAILRAKWFATWRAETGAKTRPRRATS